MSSGPGCSSIGGGFLSELGPFYPTPGGNGLKANSYAWNKFANVLFVDSPAFTGFSYSEDDSDLVAGGNHLSQSLVWQHAEPVCLSMGQVA